MERTYIASINKDLTIKEIDKRTAIRVKQQAEAESINDMLTDANSVTIPNVFNLVVLDVHNEKSENQDYQIYIVIDTDGRLYSTSSESFYNSFREVAEEMYQEQEAFDLYVYTQPSKNNKGNFITCTLA